MTSISKTKRLVVLTTIILICAIIAFLIAMKYTQPQLKMTAAIKINTAGQPTLGNENARIHIVAFEDLKCTNCRLFNAGILPHIKKEYVDTGIANYTVIPLAFIPGSIPAANAALCLHKQKPKFFFSFVEYTYTHQPDENTDWATIPKLLQYAQQSSPSANLDKLSDCIFESRYSKQINANFAIAQKAMGDSVSTPTVYINGHKVESMSSDAIDKMIKQLKD
jgi:protein-disulfide isomerase